MKTKHPVSIMVFGIVTSDGDVMLPFIFSRGLSLNMETYIKCLEEVVLSWTEKENPTFDNRTLQHHATKAEEPSLGCEKISATTLPLKSGRPTLQIAIPLLCIKMN